MAGTVSARLGCIPAKSLRSHEVLLCGTSHEPLSLRSLSFRKSVAWRLPLPSLEISRCPQWSPMKVNAVVGYPTSMAWWTKGNQPNMREINSAQQFVEAITNAGDKLVLVDFYSVGCRSCKALHPKVSQIAADNPDIEVLKINFHENNALCRSLKVSILPFFHFYRGKDGRIDAFSCSLTKIDKLRAAVEKHKGGDVSLPAPGPVMPVANWKDLMPLPAPALARNGLVS